MDKGVVDSFSTFRRVADESRHGGPKRPLCEAVKLKSGLCWQPQDVGDDKAVRYLPRRAVNRVWKQRKENTWVAVSHAGRSQPL